MFKFGDKVKIKEYCFHEGEIGVVVTIGGEESRPYFKVAFETDLTYLYYEDDLIPVEEPQSEPQFSHLELWMLSCASAVFGRELDKLHHKLLRATGEE